MNDICNLVSHLQIDAVLALCSVSMNLAEGRLVPLRNALH